MKLAAPRRVQRAEEFMPVARALAIALLLVATRASGAVVTAPNVRVEYEGITEGQATAIAQTLSAARNVYVEKFGFDMPDRIHCSVECGDGKASRLFTDGEDRVFLSMPSPDKLLRPANSGTFVLYGLCHELGHVAMYRVLKDRGWLTTAALEGWAHYAGSVVVDEVYKAHGEKLWTPDPYDYRADGTARLKKQRAERSPSPTVLGASAWAGLADWVGLKGFRPVFEAWQKADVHPTDDKAAVLAITEALNKAHPGKDGILSGWWAGVGPVLYDEPAASLFKRTATERSSLQGRPMKLEPDDGTAEGKKSIAGGGHARRFLTPGGGDDWYLTAVSVHGSRYGGARPPSTTFTVALCDGDMLPIATVKHPYKLFDRGEAKWVRVEFPPTRVPPGAKGFYVVLDFRPTASQGVFVSFDDSMKGKEKDSSLTAKPGDEGTPFEQGDWMIRIELDRPKIADALRGDAKSR
jgi:hypothetical protein